jgi:hypothetical protein
MLRIARKLIKLKTTKASYQKHDNYMKINKKLMGPNFLTHDLRSKTKLGM